MPDEIKVSFAFNAETKHPLCALLQAAYGCYSSVGSCYPHELWEVVPPKEIAFVEATKAEFRKHADKLMEIKHEPA